MSLETKLDELHRRVVAHIWLGRLTWLTRIALAVGFVPPGFKKLVGEPFTLLGPETAVGRFFDALHHTGFYYEFIGAAQVLAGLLLLLPRTAILGAVIYFPIILNIWVITVAMHFRGTWVITSLMLLACLYLLCWDYPRWKGVLPS